MTTVNYCQNKDCQHNENGYCECSDIELDFTGECTAQIETEGEE